MLLASSSMHTLQNHSQKVCTKLTCFDYSGIIVMINGGIVTYIYYGFYCHPNLQIIYMSCNLVLSFTAGYFVLKPKFGQPEYRSIRGLLFVAVGLAAVIPLIHLVCKISLATTLQQFYLLELIIMALAYISGAVLFSIRFPEKWFPGKFDLIGQSHNVHHLTVVIGTGLLAYILESLKSQRENLELVGESCVS